jgi:photosystem II stability/assembly factor-like uncharacterized protein
MNRFKHIFVVISLLLCFQTVRADWTRKKLTILSWLHSVQFINEQKGWIAGSNGTLLYTIDAGNTWLKKKNFTKDTILDVHFSDGKNGWLLCERDIYNLRGQSPSYLLKTSNGGEKWDKIEFSEGNGKERLSRFFFDKYDKGWAIGEAGSIFKMQPDNETWKKVTSPSKFVMLDGFFHDAENGFITGAGGTILFTEDGGEGWNQTSLPNGAKNRLNAIFFINQKQGWIAGSEGKIFTTANGGKLWREQKSNVTNNLTDIWFLNNSEGFAIGEEGTVLQTQSGGNVWRPIKINTPHKLERLTFIGKTGWAVGFGGTVFRYDSISGNPVKNVMPTSKRP